MFYRSDHFAFAKRGVPGVYIPTLINIIIFLSFTHTTSCFGSNHITHTQFNIYIYIFCFLSQIPFILLCFLFFLFFVFCFGATPTLTYYYYINKVLVTIVVVIICIFNYIFFIYIYIYIYMCVCVFLGLFIFQGMDHVEKGAEYMSQMVHKWTLQCYHKPTDRVVLDKHSEWYWNLSGTSNIFIFIYI